MCTVYSFFELAAVKNSVGAMLLIVGRETNGGKGDMAIAGVWGWSPQRVQGHSEPLMSRSEHAVRLQI